MTMYKVGRCMQIIGISMALVGCTLSMQNISTHGTATDLVDDNLTTSPTTDVSVPVAPLK